jgi:hypothetical protein
MEDFVKQENRIKAESKNSSGGKDYVLENDTWLGDSFNYLPVGIIDKRETGIGATTLEIISKRHSIIIEPLRITVVEKAINNPNEVFAFLVDEKDIYKKLNAYLNDDSYEYKKIFLVVDNLDKLVIQLDKSLKDYFLLFDEIDYMQSGSSYRNLMEYAIDIGKAHENFAVVSATLIDFSDPDIMKLPVTSFTYEKLVKKPLFLNYYHSSKVSGLIKKRAQLKKLFSYIVHTLNSTDDKILVALNSLKEINNISAQLVEMKIISASEITILISENPDNLHLIDKYSGKKIIDKKLPTKLNIITSAYFNGYDLEDYYRLFIYSTPPFGSSMLSINEIKQIYGRNRYPNGVLEFVLFTHDISVEDIKNPELMDLQSEHYIDMAKTHVDFANCIDKHHLKKTIHSDKIMEIFSDGFRDNFDSYKLNFSRRRLIIDPSDICSSLSNPFKKKYINDIAYFKIDYLRYILDIQKNTYLVTPLYFDDEEIYSESSVAAIIPSLEKIGFNIYNLEEDFEMLSLASDKKTEQEMISQSFENIKKQVKEKNVNTLLLSSTEKNILEIITEGQKVFTLKSLFTELEKIKSKSALNNLRAYTTTHSQIQQHILVREVRYHFIIGNDYKNTEIISKVGEIYKVLKMKDPPKDLSQAKQVIQLAYTLKNIKKRESGVMKSMYTIVKGTPYSLVKKKKKRSVL